MEYFFQRLHNICQGGEILNGIYFDGRERNICCNFVDKMEWGGIRSCEESERQHYGQENLIRRGRIRCEREITWGWG